MILCQSAKNLAHIPFCAWQLNFAPYELVAPGNGTIVFKEFCCDMENLVVEELHELVFTVTKVGQCQTRCQEWKPHSRQPALNSGSLSTLDFVDLRPLHQLGHHPTLVVHFKPFFATCHQSLHPSVPCWDAP